jgi:hypothetical protein
VRNIFFQHADLFPFLTNPRIGIYRSSYKSRSVITAKLLENEKIVYYDTQNGDFLNIRGIAAVKSFELLNVDNFIFNADMLEYVSEVIHYDYLMNSPHIFFEVPNAYTFSTFVYLYDIWQI